MPDKPVLLLVVELCTLQFRRDDLARSNIVATALFGDGAAAAVLRCGGGWARDRRDRRAYLAAEPRYHGLGCRRGRAEGDLLARHPAAGDDRAWPRRSRLSRRHGLGLGDIDRFVCHPGGPKVIDAYEAVFGAGFSGAATARRSLADYGNMSAASVLFVLEAMLTDARDAGEPWGRALLTALGPGFSAGFVVLDAT
jgi:alkylresorcinol/alkylpyrone synthase